MPIQSGDVKLLKSAVMADVPEGGGAPTGNQIADGVSNAIFLDISGVARAGGQVSMRKVFASVHTDDTDTYFGANVIVAEPPQDPRVSVTMFSTESVFDTRSQAATRVESYLTKGPEYAGYLYENHIAGQRVIQIFQRPATDPPVVGQTIVLTYNEGLVSEVTQYVRATSISSVLRTFYDVNSSSEYPAKIVTMEISDALRTDFIGSPAAKSFTKATGSTKIRETTVADAGTYVGVVPLAVQAALGDFTVNASSIFTQLVPSAQTETPISDVRTNGLSTALVPTGSQLTQTVTTVFSTTQSLFLGGPVYPGSLTIERSAIPLTDAGGLLLTAGQDVGTIDYDNGVATLSTNVFGTGSGSHTITFTPAEVPELVSEQSEIRVTPESRSYSYVFTLPNVPLPGTLSISYMSQGRWYVLRDNKAGVLKGSDAAFGTGTLNYTTGSVVVTLGALPDVGSSLLISSYSAATTAEPSNTELVNDGKFYVSINTAGLQSEEHGPKSIALNGLAIAWTNGGAKTAHDNGLGVITGDATGTVDYAAGVIRLSPNTLPASGTVFVVDISANTGQVATDIDVVSDNLGATDIVPGSVKFVLSIKLIYIWASGIYEATTVVDAYDRGGNLYFRHEGDEIACGTINYTTGAINITNGTLSTSLGAGRGPLVKRIIEVGPYGSGTRIVFWSQLVGDTVKAFKLENISSVLNVTYSNTAPSADSISTTVTQYSARVPVIPNYSLRGVSFNLGSDRYVQLASNTLVKNPSPTTGGGTPVGSVTSALGVVFLTTWTPGVTCSITNWRGLLAPPSEGPTAPFGAFQSMFRTATAPLRPGSLSVLGTMQDGTNFNVTAGVDGKISGTRVKGTVNYEYGIVRLFFVNPTGNTENNYDLSYLNIPGLGVIPLDIAMLNSLRYNAVSYSYLPLDADILGIDPVRLPSDGRVPIFRPGGFAVVGHKASVTATVSNAQVIDCARVRLSRVRVIGNDGVVINTGYTADLEAGTVTFTDVSGYSQPVTVEHRIEDMGVVRETQINGEISFTRALSHDYPLGSYVSSALIAGGNGDMFARVSVLFDQATWNGTYQDTISGSPATGTFNSAQYPIVVTNRGARTERWAVQFTSGTTFNVIGENVGVIATGSVNSNCAPTNPATSVPYFTIPALGWGAGWSAGNVLRFNTVGAEFPVWVVRTVQQGPETVPDDSFTLLIRGDVNTP